MDILFIGKRFYTNRDNYNEKFGRIYQLPYYWSKTCDTSLWLIDYHSRRNIQDLDEELKIFSTSVFSFLFFLKIFKTILLHRPKIIVSSGDCYIGLLGFFLSKICRSKFVFDIYDKYDTFKGYRNLGYKDLFKYLIQKADKVFFANTLLSKEINYGTPYIIIKNGINYKNFNTISKNEAKKKLNLDPDKIIIGYFGTLEKDRGIEDIINAVKMLNSDEKYKNLILLISGKNIDDINLNYYFIKYLGNLDFSLIPQTLSSCDILTIPYRRSNQINYGSSCKIIEYIASQRPIVATKSANLIEEFPVIKDKLPVKYIAECNSPESLRDILKLQIQTPIILKEIDEMSWELVASKAIFFIMKK